MKKRNLLQVILIVLVISIMMSMFAGCDDKTLPLPDFSIDFVDGDETIAVTDEMLSEVQLSSFTITKDDETTYYKGLKVSDMMTALTDIDNQSTIISLLVMDPEGYGSDKPALVKANFENAYFAVYYSATEDGEYSFLDEDDGPVRLYDTTSGSEVKSIKNIATVNVNRS